MIINEKEKIQIAREIIRLRLSQMIVNEKCKSGEFKIPVHLALGHEALAIAVSSIMQGKDKLLLSHRNIAYNLARAPLLPIMNEYFLKPAGLAKGRFGSMNLINPRRGVAYTSSILGNQFAIAVGISMAEKLFDGKSITIVIGGDGAIEEGIFYESLVMSRSLGVPLLFLIENNGWSMATKIEERRKTINLRALTGSLGVKYTRLSGNDPYEYINKLQKLRASIIKEKNPYCVEVKITTLGDWRGPKNIEYPDGKFIQYHAGSAPNIAPSDWPLIKNSEEDPLWVLAKRFGEKKLRAVAKRQLAKLRQKIS